MWRWKGWAATSPDPSPSPGITPGLDFKAVFVDVQTGRLQQQQRGSLSSIPRGIWRCAEVCVCVVLGVCVCELEAATPPRVPCIQNTAFTKLPAHMAFARLLHGLPHGLAEPPRQGRSELKISK